MGWDGAIFRNKKEAVQDRIRRLERSGYKVLDHASTSQGFYAAVRHPEGYIFLMTSMVRKSGQEFYFKDMTEDMGPAMNDCPIRLFKYCEAPDDNARNFRESCQARADKKKWVPKSGETVDVYGKRYTVLEKRGRHYLIKSHENGGIYKTFKARMNSVVEEEV